MSAPTPTKQTLQEDKNKVVVKVVIPDGGDADASSTVVVDASSHTVGVTSTNLTLLRVWYSLDNIGAILEWNANSNVDALFLGGSGYLDFRDIGGLVNNASTGKNGDIDLSTEGVGEEQGYTSGINSSGGTIILELRKD